MPGIGASTAYGELLMLAMVIIAIFVAIQMWVKKARLYSPRGVAKINATIVEWEPIWRERDRLESAKLRREVKDFEAGLLPGANIEVIRLHLSRVEGMDPNRHEYARDNIRLGLHPDSSRFEQGISEEDVAYARRMTGAS